MSEVDAHPPVPAAQPAPSRREWLTKGAFEAALIVLSVLLALSVDSWRESRNAAQRLAEARAALVEELRLNRGLLREDRYIGHHRRLHQTYTGMHATARYDQVDALFRSGLHVAPLRDAAWQSFVVSDVATALPFAQRALLAGIYGQQAALTRMQYTLIDTLLTPTAQREEPAFVRDMVRGISMALADMIAAEESLDHRYGEAIAALGSR